MFREYSSYNIESSLKRLQFKLFRVLFMTHTFHQKEEPSDWMALLFGMVFMMRVALLFCYELYDLSFAQRC